MSQLSYVVHNTTESFAQAFEGALFTYSTHVTSKRHWRSHPWPHHLFVLFEENAGIVHAISLVRLKEGLVRLVAKDPKWEDVKTTHGRTRLFGEPVE